MSPSTRTPNLNYPSTFKTATALRLNVPATLLGSAGKAIK
jgi:hypothetical protein